MKILDWFVKKGLKWKSDLHIKFYLKSNSCIDTSTTCLNIVLLVLKSIIPARTNPYGKPQSYKCQRLFKRVVIISQYWDIIIEVFTWVSLRLSMHLMKWGRRRIIAEVPVKAGPLLKSAPSIFRVMCVGEINPLTQWQESFASNKGNVFCLKRISTWLLWTNDVQSSVVFTHSCL